MQAKSKLTHSVAPVLLATLLLVGAPHTALAQTYNVTDVGTLGGPLTGAFSVNDFGAVTGFSTLATADFHGFLFDNSLTDVPPAVGQSQAHGFAINGSGQIAVASYDMGEMASHGLLWQDGTTTDLGSLAPRGLNDAGTVVGYVSTFDPAFGWVDHAALWQAGTLFDLGTLGGHFSYAYAVNDSNRVVGLSFNLNDAAPRAALWQAGAWHDLGTLGGATGHAYDINNQGQAVGVADTAAGEPHACLFTINAAGDPISHADLGVLGGGYSYAYAINESGAVVGTSDDRAFLWQAGVLKDLNTLIPPDSEWELRAAWAISDNGNIAGVGLHQGQPRGFRLTLQLAGDMNCDGILDLFDIDPFTVALTSAGQTPPFADYLAQFPNCNPLNADVNSDGSVNLFDIDPFVICLTGGCP